MLIERVERGVNIYKKTCRTVRTKLVLAPAPGARVRCGKMSLCLSSDSTDKSILAANVGLYLIISCYFLSMQLFTMAA